MKLTTLILIGAIMHVSASSVAQKISLTEKNAPLVQVFDHISNQTGFDFLFTTSTLKYAKLVTIDVKNQNLDKVLEQIFKDQALTYTINNKRIVVAPKSFDKLLKDEKALYGNLTGTVTDSLGKPIFGATVTISGPSKGICTTNEKGYYSINHIPEGTYLVTISYVGYTSFSKSINIANQIGSNLNVVLNARLYLATGLLNEVVVSTGYQTLPKERATGSFEVINNSLFNRVVSPNLLTHIGDVVSGVRINPSQAGQPAGAYTSYPQGAPDFSVRGLSTIRTFVNGVATTSQTPLIILDNFPYTGDINSINPNDVESITVLKDAAAASIWGARAGNGVVVISTKRGKYNQKPTIDFNTSVTVGTKPDLFSQRQISTADYIGLEKSLYAQGKYDAYYNQPATNNLTQGKTVSDVINLLFAVKAGTLTQEQADAQIATLSKNDVRTDLTKYFFRRSVNQQYSLNVRGGSEKNKYFLSGGYDHDNGVDFSSQKRYTFNAGYTFQPVKYLEITAPIYFTNNQTVSNLGYQNSNVTSVSPYATLVDASGNPINVTTPNGYSKAFQTTVKNAGLYSLAFNPIQELQANQYTNTTTTQVRVSPDIKYTLPFGLTAQLQYQYSKATVTNNTLQSDSTFAVRQLIDQYAQIGSTGTITYPINRGGILDNENQQQTENFIRASLSYNHDIGKDHRIDAIAGYEQNETRITGFRDGKYGYNPLSGTFQTVVDNTTAFTNTLNKLSGNPNNSTLRIPVLNQYVTDLFTAYRSLFANASYTYKSRYILSGSARTDEANLFGLNTNLKKKALWSTGASWVVNNENFYNFDWLPILKLRATYGSQGNPPTYAVTSLATVRYYSATANSSSLPYNTLTGLPNPNLTWEEVKQFNIGLDFGLKNNIITGSVEYYRKKANNLIAPYSVEPTTGATIAYGNVANIQGNGVDITLNSQNISTPAFRWSTRLLFSYNTDKVTKYLVPTTTLSALTSIGTPSPIVGNAIYGIYSLKWAGLDGSGNPQGYDATGAISKNYSSIVNNTPVGSLVYNGRATPSVFGSFLNTFGYKNLSVSANIIYEAGFYFRAKSVNYSNLYGVNMLGSVAYGADYDKRWQKPGDENTTYVPSAPTLANVDTYRDQFYQYSSVLVQKGDNVRLKDITANYNLTNLNPAIQKIFTGFEIYAYYNPNFLIWKANKLNIDPDYQIIRPVKTVSLGIRATLK